MPIARLCTGAGWPLGGQRNTLVKTNNDDVPMRLAAFLSFAILAGCATAPPAPTGEIPEFAIPTLSSRKAVRNFVTVVETVEPVAERICRERAPTLNCDFLIAVDDSKGAPPNAFQTQDDTGRPVIAFTIPLIAIARNIDELAFIMAHEAAHHIQGHIQRQNESAMAGARLLGGLAAVISGGQEDSVRAGAQLGAQLGARTYSKQFELEADALGTFITSQAGFDPLRGAEFFFRIPDPGNKFLGTHPANADRLATIQSVASQL